MAVRLLSVLVFVAGASAFQRPALVHHASFTLSARTKRSAAQTQVAGRSFNSHRALRTVVAAVPDATSVDMPVAAEMDGKVYAFNKIVIDTVSRTCTFSLHARKDRSCCGTT